jgi:NADPH:quinone reductase-like Zn-dependent oxidoreductase
MCRREFWEEVQVMKALRFNQFGTPSVLHIEEVARPEPGGSEALVQVQAAAINPSDVKNVAGRFSATLPRTPGRDFSGVVVAGPRYEGKQVWSSAPGLGVTRDGVHAEYAVVPAECLSLLPANLTAQQAAAIGVPFITAWVTLNRAAKLQAGETILIVGAAGAVGQAATQLASLQKARVLAAALSSDPLSGAEAVISTAKEDLRERVLALTGGRGVDVVLDAVGGPMFEPALRSLGVGGRQVAITSSGDQRVSFDLVDFFHHELHLIGVDSMKLTPREVGEIADELRQGFESGALRTPPLEAVPFNQAVSAYEAVARGQGRAKYVLTF